MEEKKETTKKITKKAAPKTAAKKSTASKKETVKKKVEKEEIKEEVGSFCPNCGKKLKPGEKCDCETKKDIVINIDKEAIVEKGRGIFETILSIYKKPYTTCKEESEKKDVKNSIIILVLISLSMGFLISAVTYASFHTTVGTFGAVADYYKISYFKVFVVWSLVSFVMAFLPIAISCLASTMFSKIKISFIKSLNLYANCLSVVLIINIISAVFILAGLFVKFFLLISLLALILGFINYLFIYRDMVNFEKDKEGYIFLGIVLAWILGIAIITSLFTSGIDGLNAFETIISTINK